jgi:hypothetical protein
MQFKPRYRAVLVEDIGGVNQRVLSRKFKPGTEKITFYNETFQVDMSKPISRNRKGVYEYHFKKGTGQLQVAPSSKTKVPSGEFTFQLLERKWVSQLVAGMSKKSDVYDYLIYIILSLVAGLGFGLAIGMMIQ